MNHLFSIALCAGLALSSTASHALVFDSVAIDPADLTIDIVVENNATPGSSPNTYTGVAQSLDAVFSAFYEQGLSGSTSGSGLPSSRQISTTHGLNTYNFSLAEYGGGNGLTPNALQIAPVSETFELNLLEAARFTNISFLGFSTEAQSADAYGDVTVHFTDNSSTTFINSLNYPDWYTGSSTSEFPVVFNSEGRVQINDGEYNQDLEVPLTTTSGGKLYAANVELSPSDQAKFVQYFTFSITDAPEDDRTYIFAIAAVPVPEAGTASLFLLSAVFAVLLKRRCKA